MKRKLPAILLFFAITAGCASGQTSDSKSNKQANAPTASEQKSNVSQNANLLKKIEEIAKAANGRVGVASLIVESGETISLNSAERFPMQSVYKLPIGMAVLNQVDDGKLKLEQKIRLEKADVYKNSRILTAEKYPNGTEQTVEELIRLMVSESDNTASDFLLRLIGGPTAAMQFLQKNRLSGIEIANYEREFAADWQTQYKNYATPDGAVELLRALHERRGLSEKSQTLLLKFLLESPTGPRRLKGLLPKNAVVAHKTGTSGTRDNLTAATNDIGIITLPDSRHLLLAVFVSDSRADETTREATIAKIARAAWDEWSKNNL